MAPLKLKAGDKVGIISTARKVAHDEIRQALEVLRSWELQPVTGKTIGAASFQFAGDDALRICDFQQMLDDDSIRAILFARGGYGTVRVIDQIDWFQFFNNPKWLCGFSDMTVVHSHVFAEYQKPTVHSLMAINFASANTESMSSLRHVLFGGKMAYAQAPHALNRKGSARGILCGGNLSILCNLLGSGSDVDTKGKILFIEDVDEHLYHLDRMMMTMKRAGKLNDLAALVVGHFSDMKNKDEQNPFGQDAYEIIASHVQEYDYPVCFGFPAGHEPDNRAMVMGAEWELDAGAGVSLRQL